MKPLKPSRPEPPPPTTGLWTVVLSLGLMVVGVAFALYGFYDAGAIGGRVFLAILALVIAGSAMLVMAMDTGDSGARQGRGGPPPSGDAAPSFDIYAIWPPEHGDEAEEGRGGKASPARLRRRKP